MRRGAADRRLRLPLPFAFPWMLSHCRREGAKRHAAPGRFAHREDGGSASQSAGLWRVVEESHILTSSGAACPHRGTGMWILGVREPTSAPHRPLIHPKSTPSRPRIDPRSSVAFRNFFRALGEMTRL